MRFKNKLRRLDSDELSIGEVAKKYNLEVSNLSLLRQKKSIIVHFSDKGVISEISEY
jgi:poly-beta-1,6-N-acetyl-D-glucosamine biosynthesis protein PgaD